MIHYWDKKLKKRLHVLEADIITIKKNLFSVSSTKDVFCIGRVPNECLSTCLSNKSLSCQGVPSILRCPVHKYVLK